LIGETGVGDIEVLLEAVSTAADIARIRPSRIFLIQMSETNHLVLGNVQERSRISPIE
jgi:hypothetical protein